MKKLFKNFKEVTNDLDKYGFAIVRDTGIPLLEVELKLRELEKIYDNNCPFIEEGIFKSAEFHNGRDGYACNVGIPLKTQGQFIALEKDEPLEKIYNFYCDVVDAVLGKHRFTHSYPVLLNWQRYFKGGENKLPFHIDVDILNGKWEQDSIDFSEAIVPKFVMVCVIQNENSNGRGLSVKIPEKREYEESLEKLLHYKVPGSLPIISDGCVELNLQLNAGDMLIFDNQKLLHGIPSNLTQSRTMFGFRSFVAGAKYFKGKDFSLEKLSSASKLKEEDYKKVFGVKTWI